MLRRHVSVPRRVPVLAVVVSLAFAVAACGDADAEAGDAVPDPGASAPSDDVPAAGACLEGTTDCVDTPGLDDDEPVEIDETGVQQFAADAQYYLGRDETELPDTIRIGRRGEESFALTEDYVIGRMTAELDDPDGDDVYTVTAMTVELPDGPATFEAP